MPNDETTCSISSAVELSNVDRCCMFGGSVFAIPFVCSFALNFDLIFDIFSRQ